jgi:hypothetical protein
VVTDETDEDGRWLVVDGRRWRRTDPALPEDMAAELRSHLGRARSAVRSAKRVDDDDAIAAARRRVGIAKRGLGERGPEWWLRPESERLEQARTALDELGAAGA